MKNHSRIGIECDYSFDMLYEAAFGMNLKPSEKTKFQKLPQAEINVLVIEWAKRAGWKTQKKRGEKNTIYIAFHPQV